MEALPRRAAAEAGGTGMSDCRMEQDLRALADWIRELIADLEAAGFENRGGKGSHRNFIHPKVFETRYDFWQRRR